MSRSQRAADPQPPTSAPPPSSSSRYPRSSLRSHKGGLGSSSTKVQVLGDGHPERGYDSEIARDVTGGAPPPFSGYHTEGQPSTKRSSKDLYRAALDPRRNGARLSSMPSAHPQQNQYAYVHDPRQGALDDSTLNTHPPIGHTTLRQDGDDSAAVSTFSFFIFSVELIWPIRNRAAVCAASRKTRNDAIAIGIGGQSKDTTKTLSLPQSGCLKSCHQTLNPHAPVEESLVLAPDMTKPPSR
jgi:hypothetical protein